MQGKPVSFSRVTTYYEPLPADANNEGNLFGGHLMRLLDSVGYLPAVRHIRGKMVTVALNMTFREPMHMGDILIFHASVNAVWSTSLEVGVRVEAEHPHTGIARHVATAYITYVGVDDNGRPVPVPPLILETDEDVRRRADATRRAAASRLEHRGDTTAMSLLNLRVLPGSYAVKRLPRDAQLPDLSCLDGTSFVNVCRTKDELSIIMDEDAANKMCSLMPDVESKCCYACIQVEEEDMINKVGMLASLSTLLASVQVPLVTVATYETFCVLMEKIHLEKVIERLTSAGHKVSVG